MRIGELAASAGVNVQTIRYYEPEGRLLLEVGGPGSEPGASRRQPA